MEILGTIIILILIVAIGFYVAKEGTKANVDGVMGKDEKDRDRNYRRAGTD